MSGRPVVMRELLAESRQAQNYWMRLASPILLLGLLLPIIVINGGLPHGHGGALFEMINKILFFAIWILVPLLTADCISRERREGTLGLLFLTPLKAGSVVLAKSLVHALRSLTFLLAAVPILIVLLLLGGLSGMDAFRKLILDGAALLFALAAGIWASSISRERNRAMIAAILLSTAFACVMVQVHAFILTGMVGPLAVAWNFVIGGGQAAVVFLLPAAIISLLVGSLTALVAILDAARRTKKAWQSQSLSKRQEQCLKIFCTPLFWKDMFRNRMRMAMGQNPIGWLHQYSWSARITKWGWCFVMVWLQSAFIGDWDSHLFIQFWLALGMIVSVAFAAANSFARERESGAMELILVTPLDVSQIISGRIFGIVGQFMPASAILLIAWVFLPDMVFAQARPAYLALFISSLFAMAVIGLEISMRRLHFIAAWFLALCKGMLLPAAIAFVLFALTSPVLWDYSSARTVLGGGMASRELLAGFSFYFVICQCGVAVQAWKALSGNLSRRVFALS